ncbi:MAG TPA: hypothetical protein VFW19_10535 [Allosphingosinicella sp.]|nr:hypothetical protein [Allosphingosinicella sp.]
MTATPARIAFVTQEWRSALPAPATSVKLKYGELARDTADLSGGLVESYFDNVSDALTVATARLTLLSGDRRRFSQDMRDIKTVLSSLTYSQTTPTVQVIDDDRQANHLAAVVELSVDLGADKITLTTWG